LLLLQSLGLFVFSSARIAGCIRTDLTTNMMESHRLMPVPSWNVLLSYLFGTTTQILALLLLNATLLFITERIAMVPVSWFIFDSIVLAFLAATIWTFSAMTSFMFRQAMPLIVLGMIVGTIAVSAVSQTDLLPALSILIAPFLGDTIFNLATRSIMPREAYAVSLPAHFAFASLFFIGACRRYRGAYISTFNVGMGVLLVTLWGVLSVICVIASQYVRLGRFETVGVNSQVVAAVLLSSLLTLVPTHALAAWEYARGLSPARLLLAIAGTIAAALLPMFVTLQPILWLMTATIMALHVISLHALYRFTRGMTAVVTGILVVAYFAVVWIGPLALEMLRWVLTEVRVEDFSVISTFSPLGLLMRGWETVPGRPPVYFGLLFQVVVAAAMWQLGRTRIKHLASQQSAEASAPTLAAPALT
jgi:hypothetical protein